MAGRLKYSRLKRQHSVQPGRTGFPLKEIMIGGGAFAAIFGFGGDVAKNWWFGAETEICREAHETMRDDALNRAVAEPLRKAYLEKQAKIAIACASRGID